MRSKTLDALATGGGEAVAAATRFSIVINLTADGSDHIEQFNKSIAVDPNDTDDPDNPDTANVVAAIATDKKDGGGEQGHL